MLYWLGFGIGVVIGFILCAILTAGKGGDGDGFC